MLTAPETEKMIARRVRAGYDRADSARALRELTASHTGDNLAHALHYEGFATEAQAARVAERINP